MIDRKAIRDNSQGSNNNYENNIGQGNVYKSREERKGMHLIGGKNHLSRSPSD